MGPCSGDNRQEPPPLPPSPMAPDAGPPAEARLPWCTIVATAAAGATSGAAMVLLLDGARAIHQRSDLALVGGVGALVGAALGAALVIADRLAAQRWRPLSWAMALAVPWMGVAVLEVCLTRMWDPVTIMLAPVLTGPALGVVARTHRFFPWLSLAAGAVTGALLMLAIDVLEAVINLRGLQSVTAGEAGQMLGVGAILFAPFGLAVGLCLHLERKRLERGGV